MSTLNPRGTSGDRHLENLKVYYKSHRIFHVDIGFFFVGDARIRLKHRSERSAEWEFMNH